MFYCRSRESRKSWVKALKQVCVLNNIEKHFEFHELIGEGNFAHVYLANRIKDGKEFAIKSIRKERLSRSIKMMRYLIKEIEILKILDHPNILKLYEIYESRSNIYLVLEYIQGGDLLSHLKEKLQYSEKDASLIILKILETLEYCHSKNIIHRDLKLENIMCV